MFNKFRKEFYRLLIPASVLMNLLFLTFSEKVNAKNIKLNCEIKNHFKNSQDVI